MASMWRERGVVHTPGYEGDVVTRTDRIATDLGCSTRAGFSLRPSDSAPVAVGTPLVRRSLERRQEATVGLAPAAQHRKRGGDEHCALSVGHHWLLPPWAVTLTQATRQAVGLLGARVFGIGRLRRFSVEAARGSERHLLA